MAVIIIIVRIILVQIIIIIIIIIIIVVVVVVVVVVVDRRNVFPVPLCPPQISHGLVWDRIQTSALRSRQLTDRLSHGTATNMELKLNYVTFKYPVRTAQ